MAIWNKITKPLPMWSKGSIIIAQFSKYKITISQNRRSFSMSSILKRLSILSGSKGPDGPDLPSPLGRKFQLSRESHLILEDVFITGRMRYIMSECAETSGVKGYILTYILYLLRQVMDKRQHSS